MWAKGLLAAEAAVELLIGHRLLLYRDDFGEVAVEFGREPFSGQVMVAVDFEAVAGALAAGALAAGALAAGALPCAGSEGRALRLAASIAAGVPADLGNAVSGLDASSTGLVACAVLHAVGHRDLMARRGAW